MSTFTRSAVTILLALGGGYIGGELSRIPMSVNADAPNVLRAGAIEIVDGNGRVRGRLGVEDSSGRVNLCLSGADGKCGVELVSVKAGGLIILRDPNGEVGVSIGSLGGRATVNLRDNVTRSSLVLGYAAGDVPSPDDYSWGLSFPRGAFSNWAWIGTSRDPRTRRIGGATSVVDANGRRWSMPK